MANMAAAYMACHAPACTCGAGTKQPQGPLRDVLVVRPTPVLDSLRHRAPPEGVIPPDIWGLATQWAAPSCMCIRASRQCRDLQRPGPR
eukprot:364829-Chlamydomonas_euryale.AAC.10